MGPALSQPRHPTPDISVVIVTYQNSGEIERSLQSLLRASCRTLQILIADNASDDGTREVLARVAQSAGASTAAMEVKSLDRNLGFTRALNSLIPRINGEFVLFLNPDTEWPLAGLDRLLGLLQAAPEVGVVAPQLINADGSVQPSCRRFPRLRDVWFEISGLSALFPQSASFSGWKMGDFDHATARDVDQPQGACLLARRATVEAVGLWDESFPMFFSDVDWCRRVWKSGWRIRFEPEVKVLHHRGASVRKRRAAMIWTSHRSFYDYLKKYHQRGGLSLALGLAGIALLITAVVRIVSRPFLHAGRAGVLSDTVRTQSTVKDSS